MPASRFFVELKVNFVSEANIGGQDMLAACLSQLEQTDRRDRL